jgi:hypothetical protein
VNEFITPYVALEGKLGKTLILLFCLPGELSRQFRDGKKVAGFGNIVQVKF